ncbi:MAG: 23S rRNA (adenine(2503)-C(2))-methyltransferase RlmN [Gammaproteobacteria bacterium]|nr:23S rRNA (adenine(2503)-C(2))-methyltransferase RlmN [Gammaproteobacteria bacterium]
MRRQNVLGLSRDDLESYFETRGEKRFRATQLMLWLYHKLVVDFNSMTNIAAGLRQIMLDELAIELPEVLTVLESQDGTVKWLMKTQSGDTIETVLIPDGRRQTLCISSQVGCVLDCTFCATGKQGFNGNLSTGEIVGQVLQASLWMKEHRPSERLSNVVFMGMGEPLLNFDATFKAIDVLKDDLGFGLSRRRVTVSTAGVVPGIERMCGLTTVALAVSLHAPNDEIRSELVPLNRRYPIESLIDACRAYLTSQDVKATITFEYTLIENVNDTPSLALELAKLLKDFRCKVNLIPFNPFPGSTYRRPDDSRIYAFHKILMDNGIRAMRRTTRGADIDAACGQLVGRVSDRTRRAARYEDGMNSVYTPAQKIRASTVLN